MVVQVGVFVCSVNIQPTENALFVFNMTPKLWFSYTATNEFDYDK